MNSPIPTILHVEDDRNDRLLLKVALDQSGLKCQLRTVKDGEEAIAYLSGQGVYADRQTHPFPALLVLDLKLPRRSGFEVLDWLRVQRFPSPPQVCILSASRQEDDTRRAMKAGACEYYVKPVSVSALVELVKEMCRKWLQPPG